MSFRTRITPAAIASRPGRVNRSVAVAEDTNTGTGTGAAATGAAATGTTLVESADMATMLQGSIDNYTTRLDQIAATAAAEGRDLTDAEQGETEELTAKIEQLTPQVQRHLAIRANRAQLAQQHAAAPQVQRSRVAVIEGQQRAEDGPDVDRITRVVRSIVPTVGDAMVTMLAAQRGNTSAVERWQRVNRALAPMVTSDNPGQLPVQFIGDIWGRVENMRPTVNAARVLPLTEKGMDFRRPKITQHTKVEKRTTELTELASRALKIDFESVSVFQLAGAAEMSIAEVERTDPSAMDIVFQDFADQYGLAAEVELCTLLAGLPQSPITAAVTDDEATLRAKMYAGAKLVYQGMRRLPTTLLAGMDWWEALGSQARAINPQDRNVDSNPTTWAMTVNGVQATVSPELPDGFLAVLHEDAAEWYEPKAAPARLEAMKVSNAAYEVGVYGDAAAQIWPEGIAVLAGGQPVV